MRQLGTEEKAALLLTSADEDEDNNVDLECTGASSKTRHDHFSVTSKRPKTYHRPRTGTSHPVFFLILILSAFIFGCLSGVVIMLYRMSQDADSSSLVHTLDLTKVDVTIKNKLFQSIIKTDFLNLNRTIESENDAAKNLEESWKSLTKIFTYVNKLSYDVTLSTYSPSTQWSGIQLLNEKTDEELTKFNLLPTKDYLTFSSLIKSGQVNANYIYYVNYGRPEDFAYLIKRNLIQFENKDRTILFMRRDSNLISQTEQIRQVIHYRFAGLVLFDDQQSNREFTTTNDRQSFSQEWGRFSTEKERQRFLDGSSNNDDDDHQIAVLILSYSDVQNIFSCVPADSNRWLPCPSQWHNQTTALKIGGALQQVKLRLTTFMQEVPVHLPFVLGHVHGTIEADHFIMVGYQLGKKQQEKVIHEIIRAYGNQMENGWHPRRSILFCAWSGVLYDRYTIRRWISDNYRLIDRNLIAYIDLGNGITGNSTLNLHGSPLLQQIAQQAANAVVSPLVHNHTCHHRQAPALAAHTHTRRRRHEQGHEHHMQMHESTECEPHKLLDEWNRASNNRMGSNLSVSLTQMIDTDSSAALFQLQHGIPSIVIEMTGEQALNNETFYLKKSPAVLKDEIQPEVLTAYTQFVSEVIRQLIDEPLIPFNLTDYANFIDKQTADYLVHFDEAYRSLGIHLGDSNEMTKLTGDLTKSIRRIQSHIEQNLKNDYIHLQGFNEKLIEFERLFIINDQLPADETYRHAFIGPAYGLTNTVVPYPSLSNLLFGIGNDPQSELCDASKLYWSKLKKHFQLMTRTLNGFDGLLSNA